MGIHAERDGLRLVFGESIGCHGDDGDLRKLRILQSANDGGRLIAVHIRHLDIHEDEIIPVRLSFLKHCQTLDAGSGALDKKPGILQELFCDFCIEIIVFRKKDAEALEYGIRQDGLFCIELFFRTFSDAVRGRNSKGGAFARFALDRNSAAHELCQLLGDAHTEAKSRLAAFRAAARV